jgi:hypothetical protein
LPDTHVITGTIFSFPRKSANFAPSRYGISETQKCRINTLKDTHGHLKHDMWGPLL